MKMDRAIIAAQDFVEERRQGGFGRIVVSRFAHYFSAEDSTGHTAFSRRLLPGFFMGIDLILGPKLRFEFDARMNKIDHQNEFGQERMSTDAKLLLLDILIEIAATFDPYERRAKWFMNIINGHAAPPSEPRHTLEGAEISSGEFKLFLKTLLVDLRYKTTSNHLRCKFDNRYGNRKIESVKSILDDLWTAA
jgi:hypothetical protein